MRAAIIAAFVGLLAAGFAGYLSHSSLQAQLAALQTRTAQLEADRTAAQNALAALDRRLAAAEGDARTLRAALKDIDERASPARMVEALLETAKDDLVARVATKLATTREHADALRGRQGEQADPVRVAAELERSRYFPPLIAEVLWSRNREQILQSPELIAAVAGAVYDRYGYELKGASGRSPDAEAIAKVLAQHLPFAQLVGEMLPTR